MLLSQASVPKAETLTEPEEDPEVDVLAEQGVTEDAADAVERVIDEGALAAQNVVNRRA